MALHYYVWLEISSYHPKRLFLDLQGKSWLLVPGQLGENLAQRCISLIIFGCQGRSSGLHAEAACCSVAAVPPCCFQNRRPSWAAGHVHHHAMVPRGLRT